MSNREEILKIKRDIIDKMCEKQDPLKDDLSNYTTFREQIIEKFENKYIFTNFLYTGLFSLNIANKDNILFIYNILSILRDNDDKISFRKSYIDSISIHSYTKSKSKELNVDIINNYFDSFYKYLNIKFKEDYEEYERELEIAKTEKLTINKSLIENRDYIIIDDYIFKILYTTVTERFYTVIESISIQNNINTKFVVYRSLSEVGTWRLACSGGYGIMFMKLQKPGDYVTGTFIHIKLQLFINNNIETVIKIDGKLNTEDDALISSKYIRDFIEYRENMLCDSDEFSKLRDFCKNIKSLCGDYGDGRGKKQFIINGEVSEKIKIFMESNDLKYREYDNNDDIYMNDYKYILQIIKEYIEKKFVKISEPKFQYSYNFNINRINIIDINVYEQEMKSLNNSETYLYYYIEYKINISDNNELESDYTSDSYSDNENENENKIIKGENLFPKTYNAPLFIIPTQSKITNYGVYDCYITGCFYFCKPIEYRTQCEIKWGKECNKREIGFNYLFIGDIISDYIINLDPSIESNIGEGIYLSYKDQLLSIYPLPIINI